MSLSASSFLLPLLVLIFASGFPISCVECFHLFSGFVHVWYSVVWFSTGYSRVQFKLFKLHIRYFDIGFLTKTVHCYTLVSYTFRYSVCSDSNPNLLLNCYCLLFLLTQFLLLSVKSGNHLHFSSFESVAFNYGSLILAAATTCSKCCTLLPELYQYGYNLSAINVNQNTNSSAINV